MQTLLRSLILILPSLLSIQINAQDGSIDPTFDIPNITGTTRAVAIQNDQKILVAGRYSIDNGINYHVILSRLNTDGSFDSTFTMGIDHSPFYGIAALDIQKDGKIIVAGEFKNYNGKALNGLARVNTDGSLDTSFHIGTGVDHSINALKIQEDGKIVICGGFHSYNGHTMNNLARVNSNGSLDSTFKIGKGAGSLSSNFGTIRTCSIQKDGKIIIGGYFISYNGRTRNHIARLNTDGSLDETFKQGFGADEYVAASAIQEDGKIVIAGLFRRYSNIPINYVARLNTDGTLDTTFVVGKGASEEIYTLALQKDGKVVVGGVFHKYNSDEKYAFLARLNADGHLDHSFFRDTLGPNGVISIAIQEDGKVITVGGGEVFRHGKSLVTTVDNDYIEQEATCSVSPNPNNGSFNMSFPSDATFTLVNALGQKVNTIHLNAGNMHQAKVNGLANGIYMLKNDDQPKVNFRILVTQ